MWSDRPTDGLGEANTCIFFFQNFCCECAEEQTDLVVVSSVWHAEGPLSLSFKEAVMSSASPLTATSNVNDLHLATSSSISSLQFYFCSTEVQGWILMCGRTLKSFSVVLMQQAHILHDVAAKSVSTWLVFMRSGRCLQSNCCH
jgi:hypothetical protein